MNVNRNLRVLYRTTWPCSAAGLDKWSHASAHDTTRLGESVRSQSDVETSSSSSDDDDDNDEGFSASRNDGTEMTEAISDDTDLRVSKYSNVLLEIIN